MLVFESPELGGIIIGLNADGVRFYFAESIKVQLANEGAKVIVLEKLRDDVGREEVRIFDNEGESIIRPGSNEERLKVSVMILKKEK